jgi:hypothetical protein
VKIRVEISYPDKNDIVHTGKVLQFSEELIKDDIDCVMEIIKANFQKVIEAADKEIWS